jgi:hypothetical protein
MKPPAPHMPFKVSGLTPDKGYRRLSTVVRSFQTGSWRLNCTQHFTVAAGRPADVTQKRMSKDLHLNAIPMASDPRHLLTERTFDGVVLPFDHEAYRRDLRKMTDLELIEESQSHRKVTGLLVLLKPWLLIKLDECRTEWRRRRPEL